MANIFENAYFGKVYKTRDGRKAIYLADTSNCMSDLHRLYVEGADRGENFLYLHSQGNLLKGVENPLDVVSEWQEPIDEKELDKLAKEEIKKWCNNIKDSSYDFWRECYECFKAGYRKAMMEE